GEPESAPRMVLELHQLEVFRIQMRINFGGGDGTMAEEFLNGPQIRASLQNMGGKGMTNHVRPDVAFDSRLPTVVLHHFPNRLSAQTATPLGQKKEGALAHCRSPKPFVAHVP